MQKYFVQRCDDVEEFVNKKINESIKSIASYYALQ